MKILTHISLVSCFVFGLHLKNNRTNMLIHQKIGRKSTYISDIILFQQGIKFWIFDYHIHMKIHPVDILFFISQKSIDKWL